MSKKVYIPIVLEDAMFMPTYSHPDDAGCDVAASNDYVLLPQKVTPIECGIRIRVPKGYVVDVRSRSGLASDGIFVINSPGTIDPFYTGRIKVLLFNTRSESHHIRKGMKVAQLVCHKTEKIKWLPVSKETLEADMIDKRGDNGFGSTGR